MIYMMLCDTKGFYRNGVRLNFCMRNGLRDLVVFGYGKEPQL